MAAVHGDFELWLTDKLRALNIDPDVFGSYITGILEGNETEDEKSEALQGILTEVCEDALCDVKDEIFNKWSEYNERPAEGDVRVDDEQGKYNVEAKLVSLMEEQAKSVVAEKNLSVEEQKLRQAILAQYGEVSDGEEEVVTKSSTESVVAPPATSGAAHKEHYVPKLLARNTNAENVAQAEKEKREHSKQEHERKKAQDKLNREKQKQQAQERKDKERKRTQKGERRR
ncbi:coiled-coil domain-containing protein 43 [Rhipicephalus microplus]|uniref:coiled-coil domain-containing protein 43 n=1 Tax=Rhipicephalus microplus TaxID=6941 RepID=UPI003F6CB5EA